MPKPKAAHLSPADRFKTAKQRTEELVNHMLALIALHESNQFVLKSDVLSKQIPRSFAANAFNSFRFSMAGFELIRLCAFWEPPDLADANIPNVIDLIDASQVRAAITTDITGKPPQPNAPAAVYQQISQEMARETNQRIDAVIARVRAVEASPRLTSVKNHRHKYLAHNLTMTRLEMAGPVAPMKNGDVDWLFEETEAIIDELHHALNRAGFDWPGCHAMHRRHAELLWQGTRFVDLK